MKLSEGGGGGQTKLKLIVQFVFALQLRTFLGPRSSKKDQVIDIRNRLRFTSEYRQSFPQTPITLAIALPVASLLKSNPHTQPTLIHLSIPSIINPIMSQSPVSPTTPASAIDPSYQPFHDARPPSASKREGVPMNSTHATPANMEAEDPIAPPNDFITSHPVHLPTPPFIHVQGVPNFRDSGGYECAPPPGTGAGADSSKKYMVRKNVLFRCAHPTQMTPKGASTLRDQLGITDIFDLRSLTEIEKLASSPAAVDAEENNALNSTVQARPSDPNSTGEALDTSQGFVVIPGVTRTFTPVYQKEDYSPVALARKLKWYTAASGEGKDYSEGFVNAYRDISTYAAQGGAYATILRQLLKTVEERKVRARPVSMLANLDGIEAHHRLAEDEVVEKKKKKENGGLIFHCTAGKDRTGVLGAVVLRLCGVDEETICWEYAITEPGLGDWRTVFIERISRGGLGGGGSSRGGDQNGVSRAEAARICGSRAGNIRQWMNVVLDGEFGGVEKYLTEQVGLSSDEVARLRDALVVEVNDETEIIRPVSIDGWTLDGGMEDEFSVHDRLQSGRGTGEENGSLGLDTSAGREKEQKVMTS